MTRLVAAAIAALVARISHLYILSLGSIQVTGGERRICNDWMKKEILTCDVIWGPISELVAE